MEKSSKNIANLLNVLKSWESKFSEIFLLNWDAYKFEGLGYFISISSVQKNSQQ